MRTNVAVNRVAIGLFHVALVASVNKGEVSDLLVDGLREVIDGLRALIGYEHSMSNFITGNELEDDLLDMEHLIFLMLEEARNESQSLQRQCSLGQLLDSLTGLRWEIASHTKTDSARLLFFDHMKSDSQPIKIESHRIKSH